MLLNSTSLTTLNIGFKTTFQAAFDGVQPTYSKVAMTVPSSTAKEEYGWLQQLPRIREWLGDRQVHSLSASSYAIKNRDWEFTVGVNRNDIEDDNVGMYGPMFKMIGQQAALFPDELVWPLLKAGFTTACYDGQYFFDTDHPVTDATGAVQSVSNHGGGAGTAWYLICTSKAVKPVIYQERKPFQFVRMDAPTDEVVFNRKEYRYGVEGRSNVGYGFWQLAFGSKQELTADNYAAARAAMLAFTGDNGRPLGITPELLVVPPSLEGKARKILINDRNDAGATNEWAGTATPLVVPWLV